MNNRIYAAQCERIAFAAGERYKSSLAALTENIRAYVRQARAGGVCSMTRANLRQVVSTRGITVAPDAFDTLLDEAIRDARVGAFVR